MNQDNAFQSFLVYLSISYELVKFGIPHCPFMNCLNDKPYLFPTAVECLHNFVEKNFKNAAQSKQREENEPQIENRK